MLQIREKNVGNENKWVVIKMTVKYLPTRDISDY